MSELPLERTDTPGIYRRGSKYVFVYRVGGRQRKQYVGTLAGTRVGQLAITFGMSEATIYDWLRQEQVDRGEIDGLSSDQAMDLAAAKRRIRQLEPRAGGLEEGR